jgi:S-adenosylhomocysteine hydrolase
MTQRGADYAFAMREAEARELITDKDETGTGKPAAAVDSESDPICALQATMEGLQKKGATALMLFDENNIRLYAYMHINRSGKFITGGQQGDAGRNGRKIVTPNGIMRATDGIVGGRRALIFGYGNDGSECAFAVCEAEACALIIEIDPICALQACINGTYMHINNSGDL